MGRLVNTPTYNFNIDLERSTNYTFPAQIDTSTPSPIYARIKNTGAGTITIEGYQIIFFMGLPAQGSPATLTTIAANQTKYFVVSTRYLPSSYVSWGNTSLIVGQGKVSIKKQGAGNGKINLN